MLKYTILSLLLASCQSGTVTIDLAVPTMDSLNPLSASEITRLSAFRLRRAADGKPVAESRFVAGDALDLGRIPSGPAADFSLEGLSESGQILAFGQMRQLAVSSDSSVEVTVQIRKPIAYIAGGPQVLVRDTTKADTAVAAPGTLGGAAGATAVTSTHDGSNVLLAVGTSLNAVSTADHSAVGASLQLPETASHLVIDRQDHILAVISARSVTLYDVGGWLAGTASEVMGVSTNVQGAVAADFSPDGTRLYVVTGAPGCASGCQVHILDAHGGADMGMAGLPEYAADVAIEQSSGQPVVALPGSGTLTWLDAGSAMPTPTKATQPRAQVVVGNGAALVGFASGDTRTDSSCSPPSGGPVKATAVVVLPGQPPRSVNLDMPDLIASFSSDPQSPNQANARITTAQYAVNRAVVTPDAGRAVLWVTANYCGSFNVSGGTGNLCSGRAQSRDEYVMVVDLASGKTISAETTQENLSTCTLVCGPLILDCIGTAKLPSPQFVPSGVTVLFGGK